MERARSVSSSSSDSWSLLEEADENEELSVDEHERAEQRGQSQLQNDAKQHSPLGQMDSLESITSVGLPLDLSPALLSQHLLVVSTPASSSIVTHTGAILSPEQSAQALANVDSPVLISPPKSPPIESTFTFLKDPRVRISFSDSYESKEAEEEAQAKKPGVEKAVDEAVNEAEAEDEVFGPIVESPNEMVEEVVDQAVLGQSDIQKVKVDVSMMEETVFSKEAVYGSEAEEEAEVKPHMEDVELTTLATLIDGSDSSELESIANGLDSISSQAEYSSGSGDLSLEMDMEEEEDEGEEFNQDGEDVDMKEEEGLAKDDVKDIANVANEDVAKLKENVTKLEENVTKEEEALAKKEEAVYEANLAAKDMEIELSNIISTPAFTASSLDVSLNAENCTIPSLPSSTPSPPSNNAIIVHANVDNLADVITSSGTENAGWTELSISMSSSNSEEQLMEGNEAQDATNDQESAIDTAQLVAQRLDELSNETEESLWQRLLDETFCSLKSFERSDRIINILIIAMFLTSISSMTILHILENTWMASNFSSMPPHFRAAIAASKMPQYPPPGPPGFPSCFQGSSKELQWPQRKTLKEQQMEGKEENNQELEQCKHELVETKDAYESKAKILHYIRMKELEQEMLLNELKRQLDEAKMALEQYKPKNDEEKLLNGYNPFTPELSLALMEAMGMEEKLREEKAMEGRSRKRRAMQNLLEWEQHQQAETIHGTEEEEEEEAEEPFASQHPTLLPPFYWPGPEQLGQLVAPPASIDSHLTAPPVSSNSKGKVPDSVEEEGTELDEPLEVPQQFWPSHFLHYFDQQPSTSGTSDDSETDETDSEVEEAEDKEASPPKRAKMPLIEVADQEGFGEIFFNWLKYNEILVNLSTQSGRNHVLKSVKNAVVTRLNRTIEKTTTALAAATKMVTAENFGQNLFTSTVKEVMTRVENSATGLSAIVDCLNTGLQLVQQNIQFCGTQTDWEEEEEAEENEAKEGEEAKEREEAGKNGQVDEVEGSLRSGQWLLATARAALRHQAIDHGSQLHMNRTLRLGKARFTGWFFTRAILREKQRVDQDNGTAESETRFSLLQDDWMYARQKARARLREKELKPKPDEAEDAEVVFNEQQKDWFFIRQKLRAKARQKSGGSHQRHRNEEGWLFSRQKLRQKLREQGQKHGEHTNDDFWATERGKSKKWRRKAHKKWKGAAKWASNANNYGNSNHNLAGDEWEEEED